MNHVRGMIKFTAGDDDELGSDLTDENIEKILEDLVSRISENEYGVSLCKLTPVSLRRLIRSSRLADKDMAKITFEFENKFEQNKSIKVAESSSTH